MQDDVVWTNAFANISIQNKASVSSANFNDDNEAEVIAAVNGEKYSFTIKRDAKVKFKEGGVYNFDDNSKKGYPSYNTEPPGLPWKYIPDQEQDLVKGRISSSKARWSIEWPEDWYSSNSNLEFDPVVTGNRDIDLNLIYGADVITHQEIDVEGCADETELKVFVAPKKSFTLDVVYVCNSRNNKCPNEIDIPELMDALNDVFNKAGIAYSQAEIFHDAVNYDEKGIFDNDQFQLIKNKYRVVFEERISQADLLAIIVNDLGFSEGNIVQGRAPTFGGNLLALDVVDHNSKTLPHEIGHAQFGFFHPKVKKGIEKDGFKKIFKSLIDKDNFMFFDSGARTDTKIRQYQLKAMH